MKPKKTELAVLLIIPFSLFILSFTVPLLYGLYLSLFGRRDDFVGLENYVRALTDSRFWGSMAFTISYAAVTTVLMLVFGLLLAVSINRLNRGQGVLKTTILIPWSISLTAWGLLASVVLSRNFGIANDLLLRIGIIESRVAWLSTVWPARFSVVLSRFYKDVWFATLLFLVARQTISKELYEQASISGATSIQAFFYITIPLLLRNMLYIGTIVSIFALQEFDMVYTLTAGGPAHATETVAVGIYRHGMLFGNYRYGTALATTWSLFITILVVSVFAPVQLRMIRRKA
ncbi:MAG: carbohydrate ABC transporter permease [Spirochaetota bacterium]